ncbi:MAG: UDP-N-acetylmuramate dehydrogenase [Anaerolineales bacterium]|nr:UDP-N-acetylmuramate dehydrogenase [Anaerolineales bacterium]
MLNTCLNILQSFPQEISALRGEFAQAVKIDAPMAKYSTARVGGKADVLIVTSNADELTQVVRRLWDFDLPFIILGGCSNVLVSDGGIREVVVLNRARGLSAASFDLNSDPPLVHADAAVSISLLAREAVQKNLSGLEWAMGIPGTLGGAIVGNAGAYGSSIANSLVMADILQRNPNKQSILPVITTWSNQQFEFDYRSSILKKMRGETVVLRADLQVTNESPDIIQERIQGLKAYRRKNQPSGASLGSMFKNPTGDYAGRLIEQAGLKGFRVGGAQISPTHANFIINTKDASAMDIYELVCIAQNRVAEKFGIDLELEIQLIGEWD